MESVASLLEESLPGVVDTELQSLAELLQVRFQIWTHGRDGRYRQSEAELEQELASEEIAELCEAARFESSPFSKEVAPGRHLLAVEWPGESRVPQFAVCELPAESVAIATRTIQLTIKERDCLKEIESLQAENSAFLRQLNEDMEELVFLRSIADKLALGSMSSTPHDLLKFVLPNLGESAGAEEIHYIEARGATPEVIESWYLASCEERVEVATVERLVSNMQNRAQDTPLVINMFDKTMEGKEYSGVREFALVGVTTNGVVIGWLVAINRHINDSARREHPVWKLGNNEIGSCEVSLMSTSAAMLASYTHNTTLLEERESVLLSVVRTLVSAIESRDLYTCGHSERVARYARRLAKEFGYDREGCRKIYLTGLLHDLGKIGLSDSVLKKEGPLTAEEYSEIQKHPDLGWAILRELEPLDYVLPGVLHHHERWDGKGYPDQLEADKTPLEGRLLAVVDAFDAMTSDRPYRRGMSWEKAVAILMEGANSQWDAEVVDKFVEIMPDILSIQQNYRRPPLPSRKYEGPGPRPEMIHDVEELDLREILKDSQ